MSSTKTINIIAAVDSQYGFGKDGKIPWHFPEDLKFFQKMTMGNTVIFGKNTYGDMISYFKGDKFLPDRDCVLVSTTTTSTPYTNVTVVSNVTEAVEAARALQGDIFFIGGESIFQAGINMADCVYLTFIDDNYKCDRFFPYESLRQNFQLYESTSGEGSLTFKTFIHNIWGSKRNP